MDDQAVTELDLRNFGPFESVQATFSPQVNVLIGTNNTGKSMLLKVLYAMTAVASEKSNVERPGTAGTGARGWMYALPDKLRGVFNADSIGSLVRHGQPRTAVGIKIGHGSPLMYVYNVDYPLSDNNVIIESDISRPNAFPVFLPAHEILSVAPGLRSLFATYEVPFDETWNDLATLLHRPRLKDRSGSSVEDAIASVVGGRFEIDGDRFVLRPTGDDRPRLDAPLVSEGHRKLGMLQVLLANGVLRDQGYLFWDEPEANLNPVSIRTLAPLITRLAASGVQVFLATHSLFLLRELQMLDEAREADIRYVGLDRDESGVVTISEADDLDDLPVIAALDAELEQSSRYLYR